MRFNCSRRRQIVAIGSTFLFLVAGLVSGFSAHSSPAVASTSDEKAATMQDYWDGNADWVYRSKLSDKATGQAETYTGAHVTVVGKTWYLFDRVNNTTGSNCMFNSASTFNGKPIGIQVRSSIDQGATWSAPVNIITPGGSSPWSCYATDGDAYYNSGTRTWYYLFQCLPNVASPGPWKGCVVSRSDASPMGAFNTPTGVTNPVIDSGAIWNQICKPSRPTDDCVANATGSVAQEGTFQIIKFDGTNYWIGFHGVDGGSPIKGFRGIAKTTDFVHFVSGTTGGSTDTPTDASLTAANAPSTVAQQSGVSRAWHENFINGAQGAGDAAVIHEGNYYYQMVEEPDTNFAGEAGQNWDYGIYRATDLAAPSSQWEPIPRGNPIEFSSTTIESGQSAPLYLGLQYQRIFKDPTNGITYLTFGRYTTDDNFSALYFYELKKSNNLLSNGNFARADASPWEPLPTTPAQDVMSVRRDPNGSPNGGQYLALGCSSICSSAQGVFQDVNVSSLVGERRTFIGKATVATDTGTGNPIFSATQYDASGAVVGTPSSTTISASTRYAKGSFGGALASTATRVRFAVNLDATSTATYRVTGLSLAVANVNPGNVARYAQVTSSSDHTSPSLPVNAPVELHGSPGQSELVPKVESTPWIKYTWIAPQMVTSAVITDLRGSTNGGTLSFSDGSTVAVEGSPHDRTAVRFDFAARSTNFVKFQAIGGHEPQVALANFEVYGAPSSKMGDGDLAKTVSSVVASSQYSSAFAATNVTDGWAYIWNKGEWASSGEANPWVALNWATGISTNELRLFDRSGSDNANGATVSFSDGTSVAVAGIPTAGQPRDVTFPEKSGITWIKVQVVGGSGPNVGLAEVSVWDGPGLH